MNKILSNSQEMLISNTYKVFFSLNLILTIRYKGTFLKLHHQTQQFHFKYNQKTDLSFSH